MLKIRQEDYVLLEPGMKVRIAPKLMGHELYGWEDPEEYKEWLGKEVTIATIEQHGQWGIQIEEDEDVAFLMEEIECIVEDEEIVESNEQIGVLLGV